MILGSDRVTAEGYGRHDQFSGAATMDEARARDLAARLEKRGEARDEVATRAAYLDLLGVEPGQRVLEVGCGTGVVLRDVARRVAPDGRAVGLDPSQHLLHVARELAQQAGLGRLIELRTGDARALPFADATFDVALAVTTLSHVPEGERAVPELARVVRPGGRVGVLDRDDDTFFVSHPDRVLTRRVIAAGADNALVDAWLGRRVPWLLAQAGLEDVRVRAFAGVEQDPAGFYAVSLRGRAEIAAKAGAISTDELARWQQQLDDAAAAGGFMVGLTQIFVWGTRPGPPSG